MTADQISEPEQRIDQPASLKFLDKKLPAEIVSRTGTVIKEKLGPHFESRPGELEMVESFWLATEQAFKKGGQFSLIINGQQLEIGPSFQPNELLAHNEYHIAKVLQVASEMAANYLQNAKAQGDESYLRAQENVFCLMLACSLHDLGQLTESKDPKPQESLYPEHTVTSANYSRAIVEKIVETLPGYKERKKEIIAKTSLFVALTDQRLESPYAPVVFDWIKAGAVPVGEESTIAKEVRQCFEDLASDFTRTQWPEIGQLSYIMAASDYGAYIFDQTYPLELIKLWRETGLQLFQEGETVVRARDKFPYICSYFSEMLDPGFNDQVTKTYQPTFNQYLDVDSRWRQQGQEVKEKIKLINEIIANDQLTDSIRHFEGSLVPAELLGLIRQMDVDFQLSLEQDEKIKALLLSQSATLATIDLAGLGLNLAWLSTETIAAVLSKLEPEEQVEFLKRAFATVLSEAKKEGVSTIDIAFAPAAYTKNKSIEGLVETVDKFSRAFKLASDKVNQPAGQGQKLNANLVFGLRQDGWEAELDSQALAGIIVGLRGADKISGCNIGGFKEDFSQVDALVTELTAKDIPVSVHLGQSREKIGENFKTFLKWQRAGSITLIIDNNPQDIIDLINKAIGQAEVSQEQPIKVVVPDLWRIIATFEGDQDQNPVWQLWELQKRGLIKEISLASNDPIFTGATGYVLQEFLQQIRFPREEFNPSQC